MLCDVCCLFFVVCRCSVLVVSCLPLVVNGWLVVRWFGVRCSLLFAVCNVLFWCSVLLFVVAVR